MFTLHPQLQKDTHFIADLTLSRLLLMNDSTYPWLILVPRVENAIELTDLELKDQNQALLEINLVGKILKESFLAEKLNIAALGNMVSQLHIHMIGRFKSDASFPKPVWGNTPMRPYNEEELKKTLEQIMGFLQQLGIKMKANT